MVRQRIVYVAAILVACGGGHPTARVEIAELPKPPETAATTTTTIPVETAPNNVDDARDPRRQPTRSVPLLTTEVQALEQLLTATPTTSPDRGALQRRLAENYVDLRKLGVSDASRKAIEHYAALLREVPTYPQSDEVLYYEALEYELGGDLMNARRTYFDLVNRSPSSRFIPYAYFAFGEMFFEEGRSDASKYDIALQAYLKAAQFTSPIVPEADYKIVLVYEAKGDTAHASAMRQRILTDFPHSAAAAKAAR